MTIAELLQKKAQLVVDMRKILDKAESEEKRALNTDEQSEYERLDKDFDATVESINEAGREETRAKKLAEAEDEICRRGGTPTNEPQPGTQNEPPEARAVDEPRIQDLPQEYRGGKRNCILDGYRFTPEYDDAFMRYLIRGDRISNEDLNLLTDHNEHRALQADLDVAGGFLLAPEQFVARLIQEKDNLLFFRQWATVLPITNAASLGYPVQDNDPADADWTAEINTGTEDSSMNFEKRLMTPHPLAKRIKVSKKLLRVSAIPVDALVRGRLAYKFAVTEEKAYMTGTGASQPLGVFIASNAGISTGRDVSSGNTATQIKADNLRDVKYSIKSQYRANLRWIFHRDGVKMISKLKDGEGQYLWQPGITRGDPDRLLNYPVGESEYAPNTFSASKYVGILGDFSAYWIADALNMTVQVLSELYAETNQNGYIGRGETDGMPTDELAFARVKMGS